MPDSRIPRPDGAPMGLVRAHLATLRAAQASSGRW